MAAFLAEKLVKTAPEDASDSNWLPAFAPEDLPKGAHIPAPASGVVEGSSTELLLMHQAHARRLTLPVRQSYCFGTGMRYLRSRPGESLAWQPTTHITKPVAAESAAPSQIAGRGQLQ